MATGAGTLAATMASSRLSPDTKRRGVRVDDPPAAGQLLGHLLDGLLVVLLGDGLRRRRVGQHQRHQRRHHLHSLGVVGVQQVLLAQGGQCVLQGDHQHAIAVAGGAGRYGAFGHDLPRHGHQRGRVGALLGQAGKLHQPRPVGRRERRPAVFRDVGDGGGGFVVGLGLHRGISRDL
jgi:hypothetical protein